MATRVLRLAANTAGRDFVIGDIHGAYDLVMRAMKAVNFRQDVDRLICVGDLVDRGADSARVERFLSQPYVFAARGNHDALLASCDPELVQALAIINFNGMNWLRDLPKEQVARIQKSLGDLPYAIEIASADGSQPTGIVHAQVPQNWDWPTFLEALCEWPEDDGLFEDAMTSRYRFDNAEKSLVEGVKRVFCGHCISWDGPRVLGNTVFADTGATYAGSARDGKNGEFGSLSIIEIGASDEEIQGCAMSEDHPGLRICKVREPVVTHAPPRARGRYAVRPARARLKSGVAAVDGRASGAAPDSANSARFSEQSAQAQAVISASPPSRPRQARSKESPR